MTTDWTSLSRTAKKRIASSEYNASVRVVENLSKYKDLGIEISRMWGMKTETTPVVIRTQGLVKKGSEKFSIPDNIKILEVQKITLF